MGNVGYKFEQNDSLKNSLLSVLNSKAWYQLLLMQFSEAEITVKKGLSINPNDKYLLSNLPHTLLLQGNRFEEAKIEYMRMSAMDFDKKDLKNFREAFLEDFRDFELYKCIPSNLKNDVEMIKKMLKGK